MNHVTPPARGKVGMVMYHAYRGVLLNTGIHQNIPEYTGIHVRVYLIINVIMSYVC